jgi:2,3-bisphosphoglycerate-dependent phosphoglycerate mutase
MMHSADGSGPQLWLVRHGESTWNVLGLAQGHDDRARLTRRGLQQARAVAGELGGLPIGTLYASDLRRARQTAAPVAVALGLPVRYDARLRERCLGVLEGSAAAAVPPAASGLDGLRVADPDARPEGGESLRDFYRRVAEFAADLAVSGPAAGGRDIAVVAHGGTLRMLSARLNASPVEEMRWEPLGNGCILRFPAARLTPAAARLTPAAARLTPAASRLTPAASRLTPAAARLTSVMD